MNSHEEAFRKLHGLEIPNENKLDFSSKDTWELLKQNLANEMFNKNNKE